jgi:hypothetical protein
VREIKVADSHRDILWFLAVEGAGSAFADGAKTTMTRADIATQHEGGGAIGPALKNVRAFCFLTNGVQFQALDQLQQMVLVRGIAETNPQPIGLGLTGFRIEYLEFAGHF